MNSEFCVRYDCRNRRFTGCKSRFLQEVDGAKGTSSAAAELCGVALITQGAQKQGVTLDEDYKSFLCAFYTEAIAGCLLDYVINPQSRNREKMIGYLEHLLLRTLPAAIT